MINIHMSSKLIPYFDFFSLPKPIIRFRPDKMSFSFISKKLYFDYTIQLLSSNHETRKTDGFQSNLGLLNKVKFCESVLFQMGKQVRVC